MIPYGFSAKSSAFRFLADCPLNSSASYIVTENYVVNENIRAVAELLGTDEALCSVACSDNIVNKGLKLTEQILKGQCIISRM